MSKQPSNLIRESLGHPLVPVFVLIMAAVTMTIFAVMVNSQRRIIEHQATKIAEVVARQALAARTVYTTAVADKLSEDGFGPDIAYADKRGHVPLPAQFLKLVGREASASSAGLYRYMPLSKWNLEPTQGLQDDFNAGPGFNWKDRIRRTQKPRSIGKQHGASRKSTVNAHCDTCVPTLRAALRV